MRNRKTKISRREYEISVVYVRAMEVGVKNEAEAYAFDPFERTLEMVSREPGVSDINYITSTKIRESLACLGLTEYVELVGYGYGMGHIWESVVWKHVQMHNAAVEKEA